MANVVEGDPITTVIAGGELVCGIVREIDPKIGGTSFPGFGWDRVTQFNVEMGNVVKRGSYFRHDSEGVVWVRGWHINGPEVRAMLSARAMS